MEVGNWGTHETWGSEVEMDRYLDVFSLSLVSLVWSGMSVG